MTSSRAILSRADGWSQPGSGTSFENKEFFVCGDEHLLRRAARDYLKV